MGRAWWPPRARLASAERAARARRRRVEFAEARRVAVTTRESSRSGASFSADTVFSRRRRRLIFSFFKRVVVVEYDGPHHFYESAADPRRERFFRETRETLSPLSPVSRSATRNGADANRDVVDATREDPGATRNVNTRLRDALLFKKRGVRAVVTVPWYAMRGVKHADQLSGSWRESRRRASRESVPRRNAKRPKPPKRNGRNRRNRRSARNGAKLAKRSSRAGSRRRLRRRARLERAAAGKARDARWDAVIAAARKDKTKVRTVLRGR